jgi:hypothetical protein
MRTTEDKSEMDVLGNILGIIASILAIGTILLGALYAIFPTLRPRIILALRKYWKYLVAVFVLFAFGYIVGSFSSNCKDCIEVESAAPVSLLSAKYMYADFNPHLIDLRTADTNGIPVGDDFSLRIFDFWLTTPNDVPEGYEAQIKVFADPERKLPIGETKRIALENNKTLIEEIEVMDAESRNVQNAWTVQPDWLDDFLYFELITYYEDREVNSHLTSILLKNDGTAWMADTPIASYAAIIYSVNNGPQQVLNLPDAADRGINAGSGDKISIHEVWYHGQAASSDETTHARLEGYLTNRDTGSYNGELLCKTDYSLVKKGIFPLDLANTSCQHDDDLTQFSWTIPDDEQELVMTYQRLDRTILDRLVLHLNGADGAPGLPLDMPPQASLLSISARTSGKDPHPVDLRQADSIGIPGPNQIIQLADAWAMSSVTNPDYCAQLEIYASPEGIDPIGRTECKPLSAGPIELGDIEVMSNDAGEDGTDFWSVPADWTELYVVLVVYGDNSVLHKQLTRIRLNDEGSAWLLEPPLEHAAAAEGIILNFEDGRIGPEWLFDEDFASISQTEAFDGFSSMAINVDLAERTGYSGGKATCFNLLPEHLGEGFDFREKFIIFRVYTPEDTPENVSSHFHLTDTGIWHGESVERGQWSLVDWHTDDAPDWEDRATLEFCFLLDDRGEDTKNEYKGTFFVDMVEIIPDSLGYDPEESLDHLLEPIAYYHLTGDSAPEVIIPHESPTFTQNIATDIPFADQQTLQLQLSLPAYDGGAKETQSGGVRLPLSGQESIDAITTSFYVPDDAQGEFTATIVGILDTGDDLKSTFYSAHYALTPGQWTPVFWGTRFAQYNDDYPDLNDPKFDELLILITSSEEYEGSVYIDDLGLYRAIIDD